MEKFWKVVYIFWPSVLRGYEFFFHHHRQKFLVGNLISLEVSGEVESYLTKNGFERAIIALKDPGEILDMRKREGAEFQYHIRLFSDGEVRAHFEYAPEAHPITHCFETCLEAKTEYFKELLEKYLK